MPYIIGTRTALPRHVWKPYGPSKFLRIREICFVCLDLAQETATVISIRVSTEYETIVPDNIRAVA